MGEWAERWVIFISSVYISRQLILIHAWTIIISGVFLWFWWELLNVIIDCQFWCCHGTMYIQKQNINIVIWVSKCHLKKIQGSLFFVGGYSRSQHSRLYQFQFLNINKKKSSYRSSGSTMKRTIFMQKVESWRIF